LTLNDCSRHFFAALRAFAALAIILSAATAGAAQAPPEDVTTDSNLLLPEHLPTTFYNFDPEEYWREPRDSYWLNFSNWVIRQEEKQGQWVQSIGEWADRTLSGSQKALPGNESYLRLGFATESEYGDPAQFDPEIRFRLDIPTVERKLRLVVESESDELIPLAERRRSRQLTSDERSETQATGALRVLSNVGDAINLSNDLGVRLRIPADAFWRATAQKQWQTTSPWNLAVKQRLYYFHQDGWGARSSFAAGRKLARGWQALLTSEIEWLHSDRKFEFSQVFSVSKRLNNRATINPRLGILGESQPNWRHTAAFADLTWRYRLHSDWLFGEIIPAVEFPRTENFKDRGSLILRIELYFSGSIDRHY